MGLIYDPFLGRIRYTWSPGPGIDMSGGTISVINPPDGVPYVAGPGVGIYGATIYGDYQAGFRISVDGATISFENSADIVNVTGSSVTLQPDTAYKILATTGAVNVTANPPAANKWAYEGHAEIFVGSVGYVVFDTSKIVLANQLEPDSVNNCRIEFRDGLCTVTVENHIAGYIVVSATGSTAGTLPYAISSATQDYVAFDASLNGQTLNLSDAVTNGEKHVVGNGYTQTILTGGISCTAKTTFANLAMSGVVNSGGTMTLGDVFIPSGSTVAVSGGGLAVEKVAVDGTLTASDGDVTMKQHSILSGSGTVAVGKGTLNLSGASVTGVTFTGHVSDATAGVPIITITGYQQTRPSVVSSCTFSGNSNTITGNYFGGCVMVQYTTSALPAELVSCTFRDNVGSRNVVNINASAYATMNNCLFESGNAIGFSNNAHLTLSGSNAIKSVVSGNYGTQSGFITLTSGAILDLTRNDNPTPIAPGGGIVIGSNVQIYPSAGSASAVDISGGTYAKITNGGVLVGPVSISNGEAIVGGTNTVIDFGGSAGFVSQPQNFVIENVTLQSAVADASTPAAVYTENLLSATIKNVSFVNNAAESIGGALYVGGGSGSVLNLVGCTFSGNTASSERVCNFLGSSTNTISGCVFDSDQRININNGYTNLNAIGTNKTMSLIRGAGKLTLTSGAILDLTGNTNTTPIAPGGGITFESGGATVLYDHDSNGSAMASSASYMMDNVTLPAGAKLTNTNAINLGSGNVTVSSGGTAYVSGCVMTGGSGSVNGSGGAFYAYDSSVLSMTDTALTGNSAGNGTAIYTRGAVDLTGCTITDNLPSSKSDIELRGGQGSIISNCIIGTVGMDALSGVAPTCALKGSNVIGRIGGDAGVLTISAGATVDLTGNDNPAPIAPGGGIIVADGDLNASCTIINSGGSAVSLLGGTYSEIFNTGGAD